MSKKKQISEIAFDLFHAELGDGHLTEDNGIYIKNVERKGGCHVFYEPIVIDKKEYDYLKALSTLINYDN